jgi:hypothetical protein
MRHRGVNLRSSLLCAVCGEVKKVAAIDDDSRITLCCGHVRPELLPLQPGRVSVESLRTEKGQQLFPVRRENE